MENLIKSSLNLNTLKSTGEHGGGCINEGEAYMTEKGKIFIKRNSKPEARLMFDGENESLKALFATQMVPVPKPITVLDNPSGGAVLIMEYVKMNPLNRFSAKLGEQLAKLHLLNDELLKKQNSANVHKGAEDAIEPVTMFGFHCTTCCGYIPQDNTWQEDWVTFFANQRLQLQIDLIQKKFGNREVQELWSQLQLKLSKFFDGVEIKPALLHGDLWGGNAAETSDGPIIFDPASFYGHAEFDLSISQMFGGFDRNFFKEYYNIIPKAKGYDSRLQLYQLFHYLNHWNHFGGGYKGSSISTMKRLINMV